MSYPPTLKLRYSNTPISLSLSSFLSSDFGLGSFFPGRFPHYWPIRVGWKVLLNWVSSILV